MAINEIVFEGVPARTRRILKEFEADYISEDALLGKVARKLQVSKEEVTAELGKNLKRRQRIISSLLKVDGIVWLPFLKRNWIRDPSSRQLPIRLFNVDRCFRREKTVDSFHLESFHTCQSVIVDDNISMSGGMGLVRKILHELNVTKSRFVADVKKSVYYAPGTQHEIFAYSKKLEKWIEVGTIGILSPVACAEYSIENPILNVGIGVERLSSVSENQEDLSSLC